MSLEESGGGAGELHGGLDLEIQPCESASQVGGTRPPPARGGGRGRGRGGGGAVRTSAGGSDEPESEAPATSECSKCFRALVLSSFQTDQRSCKECRCALPALKNLAKKQKCEEWWNDLVSNKPKQAAKVLLQYMKTKSPGKGKGRRGTFDLLTTKEQMTATQGAPSNTCVILCLFANHICILILFSKAELYAPAFLESPPCYAGKVRWSPSVRLSAHRYQLEQPGTKHCPLIRHPDNGQVHLH
jgi:hypothetical protein